MATIRDVAQRAGVSRSTVSAVLTGRKYVSPATRDRIETAVRELDFTVNHGARALATSRTMTLGLLFNFADARFTPTTSPYIISLAETARANGYSLTILTGDDSVAVITDALAAKAVDGVIVMEVLESDPRIAPIQDSGKPGVLIGVSADARELDSVDLDYDQAGALAVERLYERGSRSPAFIAWPSSVYEVGATYAVRFMRGAMRRANQLGLELETLPSEAEATEMWHLLDWVLSGSQHDGLVFHNDAAISLLPELMVRHHKESFPLIGPCASELSTAQMLPFETIDTLPMKSAEIAAQMLIARLAAESGRGQHLLLSPEIVPRVARP